MAAKTRDAAGAKKAQQDEEKRSESRLMVIVAILMIMVCDLGFVCLFEGIGISFLIPNIKIGCCSNVVFLELLVKYASQRLQSFPKMTLILFQDATLMQVTWLHLHSFYSFLLRFVFSWVFFFSFLLMKLIRALFNTLMDFHSRNVSFQYPITCFKWLYIGHNRQSTTRWVIFPSFIKNWFVNIGFCFSHCDAFAYDLSSIISCCKHDSWLYLSWKTILSLLHLVCPRCNVWNCFINTCIEQDCRRPLRGTISSARLWLLIFVSWFWSIQQRWSIGVALLALGVFMAAGLGIVQEWTYKKFSKCPSENMFYVVWGEGDLFLFFFFFKHLGHVCLACVVITILCTRWRRDLCTCQKVFNHWADCKCDGFFFFGFFLFSFIWFLFFSFSLIFWTFRCQRCGCSYLGMSVLNGYVVEEFLHWWVLSSSWPSACVFLTNHFISQDIQIHLLVHLSSLFASFCLFSLAFGISTTHLRFR